MPSSSSLSISLSFLLLSSLGLLLCVSCLFRGGLPLPLAPCVASPPPSPSPTPSLPPLPPHSLPPSRPPRPWLLRILGSHCSLLSGHWVSVSLSILLACWSLCLSVLLSGPVWSACLSPAPNSRTSFLVFSLPLAPPPAMPSFLPGPHPPSVYFSSLLPSSFLPLPASGSWSGLGTPPHH